MAKGKHSKKRAKRRTTEAQPEQRQLVLPTVSDVAFGPSAVTEYISLGVDTVYACCRTLADGVSSAQWAEKISNATIPSSRLVRRPAASMTRREWLWKVTATMALYSFCPLQVVGGYDSEGVPMSLVPRRPDLYRVSSADGTVTYDSKRVNPADWRVVRRTLWPALDKTQSAVIRLAQDLIVSSAAMDAYGMDYWQQGGAPLTVLSTEQELVGTQADAAREAYRAAREQGPSYPLVMGKGFSVDGFGVDIAQANSSTAEQRQDLVASLARYWGVPPNFVNAPVLSGSMVYQTVADAGQYLVSYTLAPYAESIADMLSEALPGDYVTGRHVDLNIDGLARPAPASRASYYEVMNRIGAISIAEVREAEGLPPQELPEQMALPEPEPAPEEAPV